MKLAHVNSERIVCGVRESVLKSPWSGDNDGQSAGVGIIFHRCTNDSLEVICTRCRSSTVSSLRTPSCPCAVIRLTQACEQVISIMPGGPASGAVHVGDLLLTIDGTHVRDLDHGNVAGRD